MGVTKEGQDRAAVTTCVTRPRGPIKSDIGERVGNMSRHPLPGWIVGGEKSVYNTFGGGFVRNFTGIADCFRAHIAGG